jgi:uncharacterized membrane protein
MARNRLSNKLLRHTLSSRFTLQYNFNMISPLIAISVFLVTALMDALHAVYTKAVGDEKPAIAATSGAVIYLISAFAVIQYTQNPIYIVFVVLGSWTGTYVAIKYKEKLLKIKRKIFSSGEAGG